jgi:FtsP/CotA-like multicopper oxidase with cupredoxin domain
VTTSNNYQAFIKYTLDGHNFTIIANDFKPVVPYNSPLVNLAVGQRSDVIVNATGAPGSSWWLRAEAGNSPSRQGCSFTDGVSTQAVAAVYYEDADPDSVPTSVTGLTVAQRNQCGNDLLTLTSALCTVPLDAEEDVHTVLLDFHFQNNGSHFVWTVNNSSFRANMNVNLLDNIIGGNRTYADNWNVYSFPSTAKAIRIHMRNFWALPHPMHLHGHDFNVLASGFGNWTGAITNGARTVVRDTFGLPPFGGGPVPGLPSYAVIQYKQDNPGVWPFHCHIAFHVSQGLYINIVEKPDEITYQVPRSIKQGCREYNDWTR